VIFLFYSKRSLALTFLAAVLAGVCMHFLYFLFPNPITALFAPVNESLWEHCKLVFWPGLAAALWLTRGRPGALRPWLFFLPIQCALLLALGYSYHILLGGEALWVDILIYLLVMLLGFTAAPLFSGPFNGWKWNLPLLAIAALGLLLLIFTLYPPDSILFADLSGAPTWHTLPC